MRLRPYQSEAIEATWAYVRTMDGNPAIVLPTGAGKTVVIAELCRAAVENWNGRVMVLAHVAELLVQGTDKLRTYWPGAPVGVYSASLNRRDRFDPIVFAQIQSVGKRAAEFGPIDLLVVDEAHRIPLAGEGLYLKFIAAARKMNPNLRVIGLTATPYRLKGRAVPVCGPGHVLTDVAYEARIPDLISEGYLSRLVSRAPISPDLKDVHVRGGEYVEGELAAVMGAAELVERTVADILARTSGRRCGMVFCVGTDHSRAVVAELQRHGESVAILYDGQRKTERDDAIDGHKDGRYRWLVNVNIASEGYDNPRVDVVVMLRPTKSPGLMYQEVGRGFRVIYADGFDLSETAGRLGAIAASPKQNCLVLDYAGNIVEHGPIDEIRVAKGRDGTRTVQTASAKECVCGVMLPLGARVCPECGHEFGGAGPGHDAVPTGLAVVSSERERVVTEYAVSRVEYRRHEKSGKPASLRVIYQCGLRRFSEWVCVEHGGFARAKAERWWMERGGGVLPGSVNEALEAAYSLVSPAAVTVDESAKYPQIVSYTMPERAAPSEQRGPEELDKCAPEWLRRAVGGL